MANRRATRRRRSWIGLALSIAAHAIAIGALGLVRGSLQPPAETPAVEVALVDASALRPAGAPKPSGATRPGPALHRPVREADTKAQDLAAAPGPRSAEDLLSAPFADGRRPGAGTPVPRPSCPPPPGASEEQAARCRREEDLAAAVNRSFDPQKNHDGEFANEARRNEAMKRYMELPGGAGYPGFGCAVFHRC